MNTPDLFWQALIFSALAIGIPSAIAFWLYATPLKQAVVSGEQLDKKWATRIALMIGLSTLCLNVGAYWDASQHVVTGIVPGGSDFLWPPHLVLYGGFLLALIVALLALVAVAVPNLRAGIRDPRVWVRKNPLLGAVTLSAGYAIFSIPGDAIWHQLFGVDLTAWSPPHVLLGFSSVCVGISCAALLSQTNSENAYARWRDVVITMMLALLISVLFLVGVSEWELGRGQAFANTAERPLYLYPVIIAVTSFAVLALARHLTRIPWAATLATIFFFLLRISVIGALALTQGVSPRLPLLFIGGAIALDLVYTRVQSRVTRAVVIASAYSVGFAALAFPHIALIGMPFQFGDYVVSFVVMWVVIALLQPLVEGLGLWFETQRVPRVENQGQVAAAPAE